VLAGEAPEEVQFTYTIGLTSLHHPEVVESTDEFTDPTPRSPSWR
jgi:hypothetical protein